MKAPALSALSSVLRFLAVTQVLAGDVVMTRGLAADHFPALEARKAFALERIAAQLANADEQSLTKPYVVLAYTAAKGCGPPELAEYMTGLLDATHLAAAGRITPELFSLPPLVRYLYKFPHCLSAEQKERVRGYLSLPQNLFGHGTINHAAMRATSYYLLAQAFPDIQWHATDGAALTSAEVMAELKPVLAARYGKFALDGHNEQFSPSYALLNFGPLLNLVDLTRDTELRAIAERAAIAELAALRANSFDGALLPPLARARNDERNATPRSLGNSILWHYFGMPRALEARPDVNMSAYGVMLAVSDWTPPAALLDMASLPAPYEIQTTTPSFSHWDDPTVPEMLGSSYVGRDFAIGAGNLVFDPAGYNIHTQTFAILLASPDAANRIECYHPYWKGDVDATGWGADRSSPFQEVDRRGPRGVLIFDIPERDPWTYDDGNRFFAERRERKNALNQFVSCRFPRTMDEVLFRRGALFLREGDVFIALRPLAGSFRLMTPAVSNGEPYQIVRLQAPRTAIYFEAREAGGGPDFSAFQEEVLARPARYDHNAGAASYVGEDGKDVVVRFAQRREDDGLVRSVPRVVIDGEEVHRTSNPRIETPFLTIGEGGFRLSLNGRTLSFDDAAGPIQCLEDAPDPMEVESAGDGGSARLVDFPGDC